MTDVKFSVTGISGQSVSASGLSNDLVSVRQQWAANTADAGPALGMSELISAFDSLRQAWLAEFDLYAGVVSDLSKRLDGSAANYGTTEKANTSISAALSGGQ